MSKRKLLLADDSVTIQKVVNLTFADEGIEVITVGDGDAAMDKIAEISPDLVLADVHMPGLSGYRICEILRDNPSTKDLPVVLLVGSFEPFDESEAARVGANAYLTKPFQSIRQLVAQVTDLIESHRAPSPEDAAEFVPPDDTPDTSDIDSLYERSFAEPEPDHEENETGPPRYVDAGMDDEMIQTSYAEDLDEVRVADDDFVEDDGTTAYGLPGPAPTAPFDAPASDSYAATASAAARTEPEGHIDHTAPTEQIQVGGPGAERTEFDLDEVLELPPIDTGKTLEFMITQQMMAEGGREVVSISPELMDVIVQKVVDKLSEDH